MLCDTSTQHPHTSAGRCRKMSFGQRQVRKPPKMTKPLKPKWRTTSASARDDQSTGLRPLARVALARGSGGDHAAFEHPCHALERLLEDRQTRGERQAHVSRGAET